LTPDLLAAGQVMRSTAEVDEVGEWRAGARTAARVIDEVFGRRDNRDP
jgi:hypothetical protein